MKIVCVIAVAVVITFSPFAYCQEDNDTTIYQEHDDNRTLSTFDGSTAAVDVMSSKITVNGITVQSFIVPVTATIKRDALDIKLSDINIGDYVSIDYYDAPSGKKEAVSITVDYGVDSAQE